MTVLAAVVEAVAVGQVAGRRRNDSHAGRVGGIILTALYYRVDSQAGCSLNLTMAFVLVLLGVAIREVWSRAWAPPLDAQAVNRLPCDRDRRPRGFSGAPTSCSSGRSFPLCWYHWCGATEGQSAHWVRSSNARSDGSASTTHPMHASLIS